MRDKIRLFVIGMLMGCAEVVPGVSGGTIAFVTGIYQRLIGAIHRIEPSVLLRLRSNGLKAVWHYLDGTFLVVLFTGMLFAIFLFASAIQYLLFEQTILIWSFFFGLVLGSVWLVGKQIKDIDSKCGLLIGCGVVCGFVITHIIPLELAPTTVNLFLAGTIAICAWILPGLSGSFILLILGLYHHVIEAITSFDLKFLITLAAGCAIGIVTFAKMLNYLFKHYKDQTLSLLIGFMMGSLVKLWPWQNVTSYQLKSDGTQIPLIQNPISPWLYGEINNGSADILFAIVGLLLGFLGVLGLEMLSKFDGDVSGDVGGDVGGDVDSDIDGDSAIDLNKQN